MKNNMQTFIKESMHNIHAISEEVLQRREDVKLKNIENAKRYAYEQAYLNKYGSLEYVKHL